MNIHQVYCNYMKNLKSAKDEFFFELEDQLFNSLMAYEGKNGALTVEEHNRIYKEILERTYVELVAEMGDTIRDIYRIECQIYGITDADELEL